MLSEYVGLNVSLDLWICLCMKAVHLILLAYAYWRPVNLHVHALGGIWSFFLFLCLLLSFLFFIENMNQQVKTHFPLLFHGWFSDIVTNTQVAVARQTG